MNPPFAHAAWTSARLFARFVAKFAVPHSLAALIYVALSKRCGMQPRRGGFRERLAMLRVSCGRGFCRLPALLVAVGVTPSGTGLRQPWPPRMQVARRCRTAHRFRNPAARRHRRPCGTTDA